MRPLILGCVAFAAATAVTTPAFAVIGEPVADQTGAIYRSDEWDKGQVGFNMRSYSYGFPPIYASMTYAMSGVGTFKGAVPKVGEVFYVHAWAGLPWPQADSDTAIINLGLPEGVSVVPASVAPTKCYVSQLNYVPTRDPGCAVFTAPTSGGNIPLGSYPLSAGLAGGSEGVDIFVPVVSDRAMTAQTVFVSTRMLQTPSLLPNPLYGDAPLTVDPAPVNGGGTATGLVAPSSPTYTKRGKKLFITWPAVEGATSYRARLKVGKKWTPWATLTSNGVKLTKLKKGRKYTLQAQATGGPVATWRFRAK